MDHSGTFSQQFFEWGKELAERFVDWLEEKADDHYSRNELNNQVSDVDEILNTYQKQNELKDAYHENTNGAQGTDAKYNDKYLSPNGGHYEIIICSAPGKDPYIVDQSVDPLNMGTYNYASDNQIFFVYWIDHFVRDMVPYYMFGNTREDKEGVFKWLLE